MSTSLNLKPATAAPLPRRPQPDLKSWEGEYVPSKNGDANLLIMFHGLGDTKAPFANLAKQMGLPFTAVLSLQAPIPVPLMDTPSFMWYPAFDGMFNPLPPSAADPSGAIKRLRPLVASLIASGWAMEDIHLFGFGQGGSTALSLALSAVSDPIEGATRFGSVVSVLGPIEGKLVDAKSNTPLLFYSRKQNATEEKAIRDRFNQVEVFRAPAGGAMPANMDEWRPIMAFWGQVLKRDESWKGGEVYEVVK